MAALDRARRLLHRLRHGHEWADHLARTWRRNHDVNGGQLAATITYYTFLSFFPLLALGFAVLGYVVAVYPGVYHQVDLALRSALPGLIGSGPGQFDVTAIAHARQGAGLIGLVGLLYSGTGALDAVRQGLRQIFGLTPRATNIVLRKLWDTVLLAVLGSTVLASLFVSTVATRLTRAVLDIVTLAGAASQVLLRLLAVVLAVLLDGAVLAVLLGRLSGRQLTLRHVLSGALLGAAAIEVLKVAGTLLVPRTTGNPVYAGFAVTVGLLVWLNLLSRLLVLIGCWTATGREVILPLPPPAVRAMPEESLDAGLRLETRVRRGGAARRAGHRR